MKRTSRKPKRTSRSPKPGSRGLRANWPKRQPADPVGARELLLVTQNESSLYRQHEAIAENLLKKLKKGRYDHSKAWKGWLYWIDSGAQYYSKHYGGSFNPSTREMAAREYADDWLAEMRAQGMVANVSYRSSRSRDPRWLRARFDSIDNEGNRVRKGDEVLYWPLTRTVMSGQKAKDAWRRFLSEKGDEEGIPFASNPALRCAMSPECTRPVTHLDNQGYVYCAPHAEQRKSGYGGVRTRKLTQAEIGKLEQGQPVRYSRNPLASNGWGRRAAKSLKGKRRARTKRTSRR